MVKLYEGGVYLLNGEELIEEKRQSGTDNRQKNFHRRSQKNTIAYSILKAHNTSDSMENLKSTF